MIVCRKKDTATQAVVSKVAFCRRKRKYSLRKYSGTPPCCHETEIEFGACADRAAVSSVIQVSIMSPVD